MNNYTLAILIVLGTAVALSAYEYTVDKEGKVNPKKSFATAVLAGAIVSSGVIYFGCQKPKVSAEPFVMDAPPPPQVAAAQSVPMPLS
jgi:hypothetical protein